MTLLIKGGRLLDPSQQLDAERDLLLEGERVVRCARGIASADHVLDARGLLVVPGLIDMHVHLRDPGQTHKEDLASGSAAAAAGGFTTICCMPNTSPPLDTPERCADLLRRAQQRAKVVVHPVAALTQGQQGIGLTDFAGLKGAGAVALSDDGCCVMDSKLMRKCLEQARKVGLLVIQHCEDHPLSAGGALNEGEPGRAMGASTQPGAAEAVMVARDLELVELTGGRYHAAHLSTAASVRHMRAAKARGLPVSCEVAPHHFSLTDAICAEQGAQAKVNPPLRSEADRQAVLEALADGVVDAIATDHAPHAADEKALGIEDAPYGISGLETAVALSLQLWRDGVLSLSALVALLSCHPARLLGLSGASLAEGERGDLALIDPDRQWEVRPESFKSRGKNTPLAGQQLRGRVVATVVKGEVVHEL